MIGPFPPPVHGMAAVNAAVRERLEEVEARPIVINLAAPNLDRSLAVRLRRLPRVLHGLCRLAFARCATDAALYMSVSGGFGKIYEALFVVVARLRKMRIFLHHHTYAYLDNRSRVAKLLFEVAGRQAVHVALSPGMAARLRSCYRVCNVVPISNAVFFPPDRGQIGQVRHSLRTVGFLSNISQEKGIFEFLNLATALLDAGLPVRAKVAGPFQDADTEKRVRARLSDIPTLEYVGPKFGAEKEAFFAEIDALIFPTHDEAEPLTLHEAMSHNLPVIAYGRGAIPEIVGSDCGLVIDPAKPFVAKARRQIEAWLADSQEFGAASTAAAACFAATYENNKSRWQSLLCDISGNPSGDLLACAARSSVGPS